MPKLTDTQLVILSVAAGRDDRAVLPPPASLKIRGGAVTSSLKSLLRKGLVAERPAVRDAPAWRDAEDGRRMMLVISDAGLQAIGIEAADGPETRGDISKKSPKRRRRGTLRRSSGAPLRAKAKTTSTDARPGTKQSLVINLLNRKGGATIGEIGKATGWQPHSVRGVISGTLKKKLGLGVSSEKVEGRGRVYRIVGHG